jgi:arylsulfatase A-like enzyme
VETVDIVPTLAALIGFPLPAADTDGRCLALQEGTANACERAAQK